MSLFTNRTLRITGGTGSFGKAVLNRFLRSGVAEIRIFPVMRKSRMMGVLQVESLRHFLIQKILAEMK